MGIISKIRERFWPIYGEENWKFISMVLMMAAALFSYTTVRITKDALIVTAPGSDAAVLSFLKGYCVMPMSILFVLYYSLVSNAVRKKYLFYMAIVPFMTFFVLFAVVLYPMRDIIHMSTDQLLSLQAAYPRFQYVWPIIGYWSYSIFYVFAELWGSVSITLLFWQFANLSCSSDETKRFYPLFGAYGNIGLLSAGYIQSRSVSTELTCIILMLSVLFMALMYWFINARLIDGDWDLKKDAGKKKVKMSLKDSFNVIFHSKYLLYIAIIVVAYGVTVNLCEVTWKTKLKEMYPDKLDYQSYMGHFFYTTGFVTLFVGLFVKNVISRFGWLFAAMMTPVILGISSCMFFGFVIFQDWIMMSGLIVGSAPLVLSVFIGAAQNISGKSTKYALFDPTVQMTYKPLDDDLAIKGKAAVDVFANRFGKSFGGHIQSFILLVTGFSQLAIVPFLLMIQVVVVGIWFYTLRKLHVEYESKERERRDSGK